MGRQISGDVRGRQISGDVRGARVEFRELQRG